LHFFPVIYSQNGRVALAGVADVVVLSGEGQGDKEKGRQGEEEKGDEDGKTGGREDDLGIWGFEDWEN